MKDRVLLKEYYELCPGNVCEDVLTEEEKIKRKNGIVFLTGVCQKADALNGNNRIYSRGILDREMDNYSKFIRENRAWGELDHIDSDTVNLKNASHIMRDIWWNGSELWGKFEVLDTPNGKTLQECIKKGNVGVSSRGIGSVYESNGRMIVEDDFHLICFDVVADPSTTGAFLNPMHIKEANTYLNKVYTKADRIWRALNRIEL